MESESRIPRRDHEAPRWHHIGGEPVDIAYHKSEGITESLQRQLEVMHATFLTSSDSILAQITETGSQLEQLEKRIDEMVKEAGSFRFSKASKRSPTQMSAQEINGSSQQ